MKRALRRFVSHLTGRNKYIFFVVVILICIVALFLGIYGQFFYKYSDTDPLMIGINIGAKKTEEEYELLRSNFNSLFINQVKENSDIDDVDKIENGKAFVYTAYSLENEDETYYSVDAQIPMININSDVAKQINSEIRDEYYSKANQIMRQTQGNSVYKVSYVGYVNSDYVSLVIKATLKENGKSEKVTIKTYVYSMTKEKLITLEDLISLKETTKESVQIRIDNEIKKAYNNAKIIAAEYGNLYERDLDSNMYKIESAQNYFLTDDGYVYIVYAYGNDSYTNEMDIVIF